MKRVLEGSDDAPEDQWSSAARVHEGYLDEGASASDPEARKREADSLSAWDHVVTCLLVLSAMCLSSVLLSMVRARSRGGVAGGSRGLVAGVASGDYVAGEGSYYRAMRLRGPRQTCAAAAAAAGGGGG